MTKILPSPIWPVLAAAVIASITLLDEVGSTRDVDRNFRQEIHRVFGAAIDFGMALLAAIALHLGRRSCRARRSPVSASRTSSSLNGLMMAMTSFMEGCPWYATSPSRAHAGGEARESALLRRLASIGAKLKQATCRISALSTRFLAAIVSQRSKFRVRARRRPRARAAQARRRPAGARGRSACADRRGCAASRGRRP